MHGEYKMPGGKLIVADVEVDAGHLSQVQISGDFFLEPDTALDVINFALMQLPADSSEDALTAAIEKNLGDRVSMYGISARAVAVAVRRALESQA
ncbi:MAG TPA: biotin--protein ligase [Rhodanobacteraceae bacterium]|nr:biotin--protein ligase [Rhodanobacteraceae bacterium]